MVSIFLCVKNFRSAELAEKDNSVSFILINAAGESIFISGDLVSLLMRMIFLRWIGQYYFLYPDFCIAIMEVDGAVAGAAAIAPPVDFVSSLNLSGRLFVGGLAPQWRGWLILADKTLGATRAKRVKLEKLSPLKKAMEGRSSIFVYVLV